MIAADINVPSPAQSSLASRIGGALLSALCFALVALVLRSPIDGSVERWSIRLFGTLMFGSIGAIGLAPTAEWLELRVALRALRKFDGRCLGCGALREGSLACDRCGHPFEAIADAWSLRGDHPASPFVMGAFFGSIASLGVLMASFAFDGTGWGVRVFVGLLALLLGFVGIIGVAGSIGALLDSRGTPRVLAYDRRWTHRGRDASVAVTLVRDASFQELSGTLTVEPEAPTCDARTATPFQRGLARALHRAESELRIALVRDFTQQWKARAGGAASQPQTPRDQPYRTATRPSDGVERETRDEWMVRAYQQDLGEMVRDLGFEVPALADSDVVSATVLVHAITPHAGSSLESLDPGVGAFDDAALSRALCAVMSARPYEVDCAR